MRRNVALYINGQKVELFDFEDINIKDSIQDVRDINKIFVPYSKKFSIPASKTNNKIFRHYYNNSITNGFDARYKISAEIRINSQIYKKGKVTLLSVDLRNDKPNKYNIIFYDATVDLKSLLGDDELSDLGGDFLSQYNIPYNYLSVDAGLQYGYNLTGGVMQYLTPFPVDDVNAPKDLIIPFISANNYYFYDSEIIGLSPLEGDTESRNVNVNADPPNDAPYGINWKDLRPSLRVPIIIDAIKERYPSLNFVGDFFSQDRGEFNRLYLWLNKDKGEYGEERTIKVDLTDFTLRSGDTELLPLTTESSSFDGVEIFYTIFLSINTDDVGDEYNVIIRDKLSGRELLNKSRVGDSTTKLSISHSYWVKVQEEQEWDLQFEINGIESTSIDFEAKVQKKFPIFARRSQQNRGLNYILEESYYDYNALATTEDFRISYNMPKMKVIDFLTGLFKMFNLTTYVNLDGDIVVEPLDEYYLRGNEIDVTKHIKTDTRSVTRNKLYSKIDFTFDKPKTFATINSNEITKDEFGNEKIEDVNDDQYLRELLAFDGGTYKVKAKFEKMQYERMTDQSDLSLQTEICWGWCADKEQKATTTSPLLHYAENIDLTSSSVEIGLDALTGTVAKLAYYYRPSNSLSTSSVYGQSLNFGSEYDEYYKIGLNGNEVSLFNRYWKNTILAIYAENSRITSLKANLPSYLINRINLNDVLVIRGRKYRINVLDVNITTGDTKLELVTYREIIPYFTTRVDSDIITVDSTLITVDTI